MTKKLRICDICDQLAEIVGGKAECKEGTCTVTIPREDIEATILGRRVRSEEVAGITLIFEDLDKQGQAISLGEATLRQSEVQPFVRVLLSHDILITALHNHWLFDRPRLLYLHFEAVTNPFEFAEAVAEALKVIHK